jgi:hypothetical protein
MRLSSRRHILRSTGFRVAVTLVLLGIVAVRLDWSTLVVRLRHADPQYPLAAVGVVVVALIIGAVRWRGLLTAADIHLRTPELGRVYAVSTFTGTFLPTTVGRRVQGLARVTRDQVRECLRRPRLLVMLLLSSLAFQALIAVQLVLLARAIDVRLAFPIAAVALALVTVATLAPISIGGFE